MALRSDRQETAGRPQSEPLEHQDQAPVHAEPAQRDADFRLARPQRAVRVSANALRTVDHRGGLDAFLLKAKDADLAPKMLDLKRAIAKKQAKVAEPAAS